MIRDEYRRRGVPRLAARSLRSEAMTLDLLIRSGVLTPAAARTQIARLASRLAGGPR